MTKLDSWSQYNGVVVRRQGINFSILDLAFISIRPALIASRENRRKHGQKNKPPQLNEVVQFKCVLAYYKIINHQNATSKSNQLEKTAVKEKTVLNLRKALAAVAMATIAVSSFSVTARAGVLWNENTQGDLSNYRLVPTQLPALVSGDNSLSIVIDNPNDAAQPLPLYRDLDYFVITIPEGLALSKLILDQYVGGDDIAFIGMQQGTQFTEPTQPQSIYDTSSGTTNPANLLGYALVGTKTTYGIHANCGNVNGQNLNNTPLPPGAVVHVGEDILPILGNKTNNRPDRIQPNNCNTFAPPSGFTAPLTAGNYVFWAQQTVPGATKFTMNFVASTVPESTSPLGILVFGALGLGLTRRKH